MTVIQRSIRPLLILALLYGQTANICGATLCSTPCLLVANTSDIVAMDYQTAALSTVVSGLTRAVAIDVHFSLGYIFWSDVTEKNIKRFRIDVASTTTIITGIGVCDGLAVDWRASQLYRTDTTYGTISVSDLDGNNQGPLISGLDKPRGIALDLDNSLMFWTDWGVNEKIERASLNGGHRVAIVTTYLYLPNGIELDTGNKRIFWVDAGYDRVESVDYNGNNRKLLYQLSGLHPFGLTLIPPFLFFTDWVTAEQIHQLDATTGRVIRKFSANGGQPMGIVTYDASRQPAASNPCTVNNGGCSHFCVTKSSGYECVCPTGLAVKQDGKTCEDKVKKFILFADADGKSTNYVSLDTTYSVSLTLFHHLGAQRPIALDYDPVEERVYWSDIAQGLIISAFFNATSVKTLYRCNVRTPGGVAIDHVGRNIYWTDTGTNRIEVGKLDGTGRKLLIKGGLDEPRAIVLDEKNGMMYWTDWGSNPKIEKAEMDGSARRIIVTGNLVWPNGLTIHQETNRLFWADAKLDKIEVSDLNGANRQLIMSSVADIHPYGLAVYHDMLYWTDWNAKSISKYNLTTGNKDTLVDGLQKPMDIHIFDPALIFSGFHNCSQNNGLCSDFCLLKPGGYQCACPTGIALKSDGKTCDHVMFDKTSSDKFVIFAEAGTGEIYKVPLEVPETPCYPLEISTNISGPVAVDYDPVEGKIYWSDVTLKLVARAFPNGSSVYVIAYNNVIAPEGLAVDYTGRNIYWTDQVNNTIEVAKMDGSSRRSLITTNIEKPRAILLDIGERKMYWGGISLKIEQANMDGTGRTTLVSSGLTSVNSLAMDYQSRLLYWCDGYHKRIERVDLQGNNRVVILDLSLGSTHPFGLALFGDAIFWSDWNSQSIHKYNMTTSVKEVVVHGMRLPMELHVYDKFKLFTGSTSCSQLNGGCSHLCLPNPSGHRCFCPEGVQLKPGDAFTCEGVNSCPRLTAPAHGSLAPCNNFPGHICHFSCDIGYILTGSATRTCASNGVWTGTQPQCNAVTCSALLAPPNGIRQGCTGTTTEYYSTVCLFSCNAGFIATGSPSRKCLRNGTWSGQEFLCQGSSCVPLDIPPKAILLTVSCGNTYGSNCVFGCQTGYGSVDGNVTRTCLQTGQWSRNPINCTAIRCPSLSTPTSGVKTGCTDPAREPYNTQCSFSCNVGYNLIGSSVRRCLENGTWSGETSYCRVISCGPLAPPTHGVLHVSPSSCLLSSPYGQRCIFTCQTPGYVLEGTPVRVCGNDGQWTGLNSTNCRAVTCSALLAPPNGIRQGCTGTTTEYYSTVCLFSCNAGFIATGSPSRKCLRNGTWSGQEFLCQVVKCPSIAAPSHGKVFPSTCQIPSGVNYKSECFFMCNVTVGYQLQGASKVSCLESGSWSIDTTMTICRDIQAPSITCPPDMDNIPTEPGQSYASVQWQLPVSTDNSNESLTLTGLRPPQKLNVGKRYITYTVTDSSGLSRGCVFVIHIKDLEPPKIVNCPGNIHKTSKEKWTKIFFPGVTVTDNVGVHLFTTSRPNGSEFTWGENNVTYTASDNAGNTAKCHFQIVIVAKPCDDLPTPQNGAKACDKWLVAGKVCTLHCNVGYDFANKPPGFYACGAGGKWIPHDKVPDCSKTRQAETLLASELHYLASECTEEMHSRIAINFIALYTRYLRTIGGCDGDVECTVENVEVECGRQSGTLRRRDVADGEQPSKVPLTVKFGVKVPLPSNASVADLNQTTQQISSDILASLNETDLTLTVSGIVLEYDTTRPPVVRILGLVCDKGQVLKGTKCVNCPLGYFFNSSGCQACVEDHYQDQEAQNECVTCPSGTSTFGQTGSKESKDCQEIPNPSSTEKQVISAMILYPAIASGSLLVIAVTAVAIFFLRKRLLGNRRPTHHAGSSSYGTEGNVGFDNQAFGQTNSIPGNEPEYMEIGSLQQPRVGFNNPSFESGDHYQALNNKNAGHNDVYERLDFSGQSEA
ncbi:uncharacterized protein LOC114968057 isoform X2 [Acropora millepora]|nr:uncharacterized protein LOC114968057 isoform X2 [Acropora millepora]